MSTTLPPEADEQDGVSLSSISTIIGLSLFFLFIFIMLARRLYVRRQIRVLRARGRMREMARRDWDTSYDEPRTIALGARAALLRRPILWEDHLTLLDEKSTVVSSWNELQPTSFQFTTPHTTALFPGCSKPGRPQGRYQNFFHHHHGSNNQTPSNSGNLNGIPTARVSTGTASTAITISAQTQARSSEEKPSSKMYPHRVHPMFLISMPDAQSPRYTPSPSPPIPSPHLPIHSQSLAPPSSYSLTSLHSTTPLITPLEFGTTDPCISLPSIRIPQTELDSWWDLPNVPVVSGGRRGAGLMNTREREREGETGGWYSHPFQFYP